jgi:hypothetical protein
MLSQCHLGSPVRENRTPGSAWGDENKRPCPLGEASARKRWRPQGPHGLQLSRLVSTNPLDDGFEKVVKPRLKGKAHEIRFAEDAILCFQHREDAEKVRRVLPKRFAKFGLALHPEKTRRIEFGRFAEANAKRRGRKPATFDFLGFTHICACSRKGKFVVHTRTIRKRLRRGLKAISEWCQEHRHDPVGEQQKTLNAKLRGHYQYYGRPTNYHSLQQFYRSVRSLWRKWLSRRTRGKWLTWERYAEILRQYPLLQPQITRAWASASSTT